MNSLSRPWAVVVLSFTCLFSLGAAYGFGGRIDPVGQNPEVAVWRKSKASALKVAQTADAAMGALKNVQVETSFDFEMPERKINGHFEGIGRIGDSRHFAVRYAVLSFLRREEGWYEQLWGDGKKVYKVSERVKNASQTPIGKFQPTRGATPDAWVLNSGLYTLSGAMGAKPLTQLVTAALKPGSGYEVVTAERVVRKLNKEYPQYQIVIKRTPTAAQMKGDFYLAVTVDGRLRLPLLISSTSRLAGKEAVKLQNRIAWKLSRKVFPASSFRRGAPIVKE